MHLRTILITAALTLPAMAPLISQTPPSPTTLAALRDHYRPLLVFAPSPDDPALVAQFHMLQNDAAALHERDILLIAIPFHNPAPSEVALTPADALDARRRFGIAPGDFEAVLIGKDGGSKLHAKKPVSLSKLCSTVDSMPMRQQEMQHPKLSPEQHP